ncbi:MAG: hypothetical protein D6694_10505 [Gammaproteobacteria bacterium]|nr:MAG: hypothetical protein D6694_10505 [Gammaproteobacteria bacterium]
MTEKTFMTTEELAQKLRYDPRYIRNCLKDAVFLEGVHYIRPFGRRKILYIWEAIERDLTRDFSRKSELIPMANGGVCRG